jgi:hypothetical protein
METRTDSPSIVRLSWPQLQAARRVITAGPPQLFDMAVVCGGFNKNRDRNNETESTRHRHIEWTRMPFRIQVCVVEPGGYKTEIFESNAQHSRAPAGSVYALLQAALDKSYQAVSRRDPEDFANVVLGLMRNPASPFRTRTSDDVRRVYRLRRLLPSSAFSSLFWRKAFPDLAQVRLP